ncbi:hypothetical protein D3C86_1329230 [compost metagenome]
MAEEGSKNFEPEVSVIDEPEVAVGAAVAVRLGCPQAGDRTALLAQVAPHALPPCAQLARGILGRPAVPHMARFRVAGVWVPGAFERGGDQRDLQLGLDRHAVHCRNEGVQAAELLMRGLGYGGHRQLDLLAVNFRAEHRVLEPTLLRLALGTAHLKRVSAAIGLAVSADEAEP